MAYLTLTQAKKHLRVTIDDENDIIALKLAQAEAIILDYLDTSGDPTWTSVTVPGPVQSATLLMLAHLYEHRGEDLGGGSFGTLTDEALWEAVGRLLVRLRDPALA